jgi:hypothetical protein
MTLHEFAEAEGGRMKSIMKGLKENQILGLGEGNEVLGLFFVGSGGFFEENVFPGLEGFTGPFVMKAVGKGVVNAVDFWVGDERVVGDVCVWDPVLVRICLLNEYLQIKKKKKWR